MNNVNNYVDYFRQLAVKHQLIRHNPAAEVTDTENNDMRFCKWSTDELISGLRSKVSFPAILIELYDTNISNETITDIRKTPRGAFTVLQNIDAGSSSSQEESAYAITEEILYDFLKQIYQDHYGENKNCCNTPFKSFRYNHMDISPTGNILNNKFGWRVEFDFVFNNDIDITEAPAVGVFIES